MRILPTAGAQCQWPGAIGVLHATKGEVAVMFAVLKPGVDPTTELAAQISGVRGKPLRPQAIYFAPDLPQTPNARIMRRVVRAMHLGKPPGDISALENPAAVRQIPRLGE
jgi:acetyl-CoA synthetase